MHFNFETLIMKKILLNLAIVALIVSCGTDDEGDTVNDEMTGISGETYLLTSFEAESSFDLDGDGDSSRDLLEETGCLQNERLVFGDNGIVTAISSSFLDIFVEVDSDGNLMQFVECEMDVFQESLSFMQTGSTIVITDTEEGEEIEEQDQTIGVIDGNTLVFTLQQGFVGELIDEDSPNGTTEVEEMIVITYTRQ